MRSDYEDVEFESLQPRIQRLLFSRLRAHAMQLSETAKLWHELSANCPSIDRDIYIGPNRPRIDSKEDDGMSYHEKEPSRLEWSVSETPYLYLREEPPVEWYGWRLVSETSSSEFQLACEHALAYAALFEQGGHDLAQVSARGHMLLLIEIMG